MKTIFIYGPSSSGTRLFTCLIERHPEVKNINHNSFPSGPQVYNELNLNIEHCDFLVIVDRNNKCIDKSNYKYRKWENISKDSKIWIQDGLEKIKKENPGFEDKILYVSYELLVNYKIEYLKQIFKNIGLNPKNYDYDFENIKDYKPKKIFNPESDKELTCWFQCNLSIKNGNTKY